MTRSMRTFLLSLITLALAGCDPVVCADTDPGPGVDSSPTGGPEVVPPPDKTCGQIVTDPKVACGLACVDEYGISVVILCELAGSWECKIYPRSGPIIGETYQDLPVWCGG